MGTRSRRGWNWCFLVLGFIILGLSSAAHQLLADSASSQADPTTIRGNQSPAVSVREQLKAHRDARRNHLTGQPETKKAAFAPGRLVVKYKDSLETCAHCLFGSPGGFKQALRDRSTVLDTLNQEFGVHKITPVFRTEAIPTAQLLAHGDLKAQWQAKLSAAHRKHGGPHRQTAPVPAFPDLSHVYVLEVPETVEIEAACKQYAANPHVEYCHPDYLIEPQAFPDTLPNDTYLDPDQDGTWSTGAWGQPYEDLWGLKKIQAHEAWKTTLGEGVVVAVVDTGVDYLHEDLTEDVNGNGVLDPGEDQNGNGLLDSNIWINPDDPEGNIPDTCDRVANPTIALADDDCNGYVDDIRGWNFLGNNNNPDDLSSNPASRYGHGTRVAGIIAALANNGRGIIGVAPKTKIMAIRALPWNILGDTAYVSGVSTKVANGIVYAALNGAHIINNSWASTGATNPVVEDAIRLAAAEGVVVLLAATWATDTTALLRMTNPKPIVVAATDERDNPPTNWAFGSTIDVAAPGFGAQNPSLVYPQFNILSTKSFSCWPCYSEQIVGTKYYRSGGTSLATAYAAGVSALLRARHPEATPDQIRQILRASADDVHTPGFDAYTGAGRLNVARALTVESVPVANISSPAPWALFQPEAATIPIVGTATWQGTGQFSLFYGVGLAPTEWVTLTDPTSTPRTDEELAVWRIDQLTTGVYSLRLVVSLGNGMEFEHVAPVAVEQSPIKLTNPEARPTAFAFSENRIVWEDWRIPSEADLYLCEYNATAMTCAERPLVTAQGNQQNPRIDGMHVVWEDYRLDHLGDIFRCSYEPEAGSCTAQQLTIDDPAWANSTQINPDVFEDVIVWQDSRNIDLNPNSDADDWDDDIYYCRYDVETQACPNTLVQRNTDPQQYPKISGRWIVFEDNYLAPFNNPDAEDDVEIYAFNYTQTRLQQVTSDPDFQFLPAIDGGRVVWVDDRNVTGSELYLEELGISTTDRRITPNITGGPTNPSMSGNRIVWQDYRYGNADIYVCEYDSVTHLCPERAITSHPADQSDPKIAGTFIVWADFRNGTRELFLYDLNETPQIDPVPDGTVNEGDLYTFEISVRDTAPCEALTLTDRLGDGSALSTVGATLDPVTSTDPCVVRRRFSWTPPATYVTPTEGTKPLLLVFEASDGSRTAQETVMITVRDVTPDTSFRGVVQLADGTPIPFVHVKLTGKSTTGIPVKLTVLTNAEGRYRFQNLPSGTYKLTARLKKYLFSPLRDLLWPGALPPVWTPLVPGPTIPAAGTRAVRGTLTRGAGAQVQLRGKTTTLQAVKLIVLAGPDGTYAVEALPPGTYTVQPKLKGKMFTPSRRDVILTTSDATINFTTP